MCRKRPKCTIGPFYGQLCQDCTWTCGRITALTFVVQAAAEDSRLQPALQEAGLTAQKLESAIQVWDFTKRFTCPVNALTALVSIKTSCLASSRPEEHWAA